MQPAVAEYLRRLALLPQVLARVVRLYARDPLRNLWPAAIGTLAKLLPTALFDNRPPERYLRALLAAAATAMTFVSCDPAIPGGNQSEYRGIGSIRRFRAR